MYGDEILRERGKCLRWPLATVQNVKFIKKEK